MYSHYNYHESKVNCEKRHCPAAQFVFIISILIQVNLLYIKLTSASICLIYSFFSFFTQPIDHYFDDGLLTTFSFPHSPLLWILWKKNWSFLWSTAKYDFEPFFIYLSRSFSSVNWDHWLTQSHSISLLLPIGRREKSKEKKRYINAVNKSIDYGPLDYNEIRSFFFFCRLVAWLDFNWTLDSSTYYASLLFNSFLKKQLYFTTFTPWFVTKYSEWLVWEKRKFFQIFGGHVLLRAQPRTFNADLIESTKVHAKLNWG